MKSEELLNARKRILLGLIEADPSLVKWLKNILTVYGA